ncbi:uncharacterized protein LOC106398891 [Brassica napus]|uniref:uncharacterized protein LOC106398891 n=1 Tax=Brassica napus TaxID=3708 RepID=UPI00207ABF15|nr:uncharacterized protein LOC106398891 [Brassica napus]
MVLRVSYVLVVLTILSMDHRISQATSRVAFQKLSIADYFEQWMIQFSRVYINSLEKQMRLEVFKKNLEYIENFNTKENKSYKLGVDEFTDRTDEEFLATHTGLSGINVISSSEVVDESMSSSNWNVSNIIGFYAKSKDWRLEGAGFSVSEAISCPSPEPEIFSINSSSESLVNALSLCVVTTADGFHYRQPWVIGVQEHNERLTSRVEEVEAMIKWVPEVNNKIKSLEAEVKALTVEVDRLTGKVYNLTVQVDHLEKCCFD